MRKYQPKPTALSIIKIAVLLLCTALSVLARIYLVSFEILMTVLVLIFWTAGVIFGFVLMPGYFRRTVVYISGTEICLHTGIIFKKREYMKMSAVQYVTSITCPLSSFSGFNFILVRGLGGTVVLPFLRNRDCEDITSLLNVKINEK